MSSPGAGSPAGLNKSAGLVSRRQFLEQPRGLGLVRRFVQDQIAPERRIAGEHLVSAFAGQHDFDAGVAYCARQQELGNAMPIHDERYSAHSMHLLLCAWYAVRCRR
jgi:hypothetical protein